MNKDDNLTSIPELPLSVLKWGRCLLLHEKYPIEVLDTKPLKIK